MGHEIEDGEVAIIIKPEVDEEGEWNGSLKTGSQTLENDLMASNRKSLSFPKCCCFGQVLILQKKNAKL